MDFFEFRELTEAFDKPYKFKSDGLSKKIGDVKYTFMTEVEDGLRGDEVDVHFDTDRFPGHDKEPTEDSHYTVSFDREGQDGVTGDGDAMRVFATVIAIIKDFVKKRNPKLMGFSAFKDVYASSTAPGKGSREKLYARMLQRYAGKMGYKYYKVSGVDKTEFELRRK